MVESQHVQLGYCVAYNSHNKWVNHKTKKNRLAIHHVVTFGMVQVVKTKHVALAREEIQPAERFLPEKGSEVHRLISLVSSDRRFDGVR